MPTFKPQRVVPSSWRCDYCYRDFQSKEEAEAHEAKCLHRPSEKNCYSCAHSKAYPSTHLYCGLKFRQEHEDIMQDSIGHWVEEGEPPERIPRAKGCIDHKAVDHKVVRVRLPTLPLTR